MRVSPRFNQFLAPVVLVAALLAALVAAPLPARQPHHGSRQDAQRDDAWRALIRRQLYIPEALPPLESRVWSTFRPMPGVLADRVTYGSADGMLVPAIVYRPDPAVAHWRGKLPGLVIVNGHGSDKYGWYAYYSGLLFAKAGAVVVTYDPIGEGERNARRLSTEHPSPHDRLVPPPPGVPREDWGRRLAGLMQVDLLQAVSYLDSLPGVDARRIGVAGYSLGAFVAGIEGAYDRRVHALVLSAGGTFDGDGEYFDNSPLPCQGTPYRSLGVLGDRSAVLYDLNADRGPTLVMNGTADTVVDIRHHNESWFNNLRERAISLRGTDAGMFTTRFYPGVSHRPSWMSRDGVKWLDAQLHFALWSREEQVDAAGTTHISEWLKANGVAIAPNYFPEAREGGIEAVGTGFPRLSRADLTVLPERDWQRLKDRLTYEGWAEKTLAAQRALLPFGNPAQRALLPSGTGIVAPAP